MSKALITTVATIAAIALAGCGGSRSSSSITTPGLSALKSGFQAQSRSVTALGTDLQTAIATASTTSQSKIAVEFSALASRATKAAAALRALNPPAKYGAEVRELAAGFDGVAGDMTAVSAAAKKNDATEARSAAAKLVNDWETVQVPDLKLTRDLGLPVTG
jgi:hypothetical protein